MPAARPRALPAAAPVLVGSKVAFREDGFALVPAMTALFCASMIQIGTNYHNGVSITFVGQTRMVGWDLYV